MSIDTSVPDTHAAACKAALLQGLWQLARPRILGMVLFTLGVTALIAGEESPGFDVLFHSILGSALVIVGAISLNQRLEGDSDAKMARTAMRPLPAGLLSKRAVTLFGLCTSSAGFAYLWFMVNPGIVVLAVISWMIYVWIYTPLKIFTAWQTPIGAVAGAMPTLLGAAAVQAPMSPAAVTLFGLVFFWQFPHAMAIAWLYRDQFAHSNSKVATVVDPSGRLAGVLSVAGAFALLPVSWLPLFFGQAGWVYGAFAIAIGLAYLASSVRFLLDVSDRHARTMLRASFLYLPAVFFALVVAYRA